MLCAADSGTRRFTRLTNAFNKKNQSHEYAVAVFYMHHNFVCIESAASTAYFPSSLNMDLIAFIY
jgi:hypothetical protein